MITTLLCTRGMIFGETIKSLHNNLCQIKHIPVKPIIGLPIPDAQNAAVRQALETKADLFLFVEEDMVIPDGTVLKMVGMDEDIVAVNYPVDGGWGTVQRDGEEIIFCGLGCTLFKRHVFEKMKDPWFDTSHSLRITSQKPFKYEVTDLPYKYGGLDNYFCHKARELGLEIHQLMDVEAKHLRLIKNDDRKLNKGTQEIKPLPPISKHINY